MEFCDNCKVHVKHGINCPLCGKSVAESNEPVLKRVFPKYAPIPVDRVDPVVLVITKLMIWLVILSFALELFIFKTVNFSLYVLFSAIYIYFVVLKNIRKRSSFAKIMSTVAFFTPLLILYIELATNSFGWGMCLVVPFLWLGIALFGVVVMFIRGWVDFEMFRPMIIIAIMSTVLLICLMCFNHITWPTLVIFLTMWSLILFMFMFRFKRTVRSLKKDFRM